MKEQVYKFKIEYILHVKILAIYYVNRLQIRGLPKNVKKITRCSVFNQSSRFVATKGHQVPLELLSF